MRPSLSRIVLVTALFGASPLTFAATEDLSGKEQYTLLNPTPTDKLREFETDRPDKTESPYTVDAGHFQIEGDWVNYSYDRHNPDRSDVRVDSFSFASLNLKEGLLNNLDIQLIVPAYNYVRIEDLTTKTVKKNSGFGDLVLRLKYNIWGNDGGKTAFAVMPFLKAPTAQDNLGNDAFEGGIIFPVAIDLSYGWGLGAMTEFDFNKDTIGSGRHTEFVNTVTFNHAIGSKLEGYMEFFSAVSMESNSEWIGTADFGLVYAVTENFHLDGGINIGVTRAADDLNPFIGFSARF